MFLCSDASAACAADGAMPQGAERGQHGDDDERHDARGAPAHQAQAGTDDMRAHDLGRDASSIITLMMGSAITPLHTAAQNSSATGSSG